MTLIDAWLEDLRREDDEIAVIVRKRDATSVSAPLAEVAARFELTWTIRGAMPPRNRLITMG